MPYKNPDDRIAAQQRYRERKVATRVETGGKPARTRRGPRRMFLHRLILSIEDNLSAARLEEWIAIAADQWPRLRKIEPERFAEFDRVRAATQARLQADRSEARYDRSTGT
jgi:hypothetical protein